jgi:hypothetical protein
MVHPRHGIYIGQTADKPPTQGPGTPQTVSPLQPSRTGSSSLLLQGTELDAELTSYLTGVAPAPSMHFAVQAISKN